MCGIFGYVATGGKVNMKRLRDIAIATETRGQHAFGFAWLDAAGRLKSYKATGRITDNLALLGMTAGATMIVGHCRYATQGNYKNNLNNHPFACDGGWVVHNGMIPHYQEIADDWGLPLVTQCDSEVIPALVERMDGDMLERMAGAVGEVARFNTAAMGLWKDPGRLIVARAGNPMHMAVSDGGVYLASLPIALPGGAEMMNDNEAMIFVRNPENGDVLSVTKKIDVQRIEQSEGSLFATCER